MEAQLIEKLFKNYTSNARPVKKLKNSVDMKFDIAINQLLDVVSLPILFINHFSRDFLETVFSQGVIVSKDQF